MPHKSSAGTYMLTADHTEALARLASDPAIAGLIGPSTAEFITRQLAARAEGTGHGFVIVDGGEVMGLCTLQDIGHADGAEVGVWIDQTQRGKGYATFAVGMMLDLAFRNLGQSRVRARVPEGNPGARRVFEKISSGPGRHRSPTVSPTANSTIPIGGGRTTPPVLPATSSRVELGSGESASLPLSP